MAQKPTVTFTFIRHGESTDNLTDVWAGWKDAPLSNHGMNQAKALGASLARTRFTAIYASPLKRALWTAQAVHDAQPEPKPPLELSPLLREQHFGVAEGKKWVLHRDPHRSLESYYAEGLYPVLHGRTDKFEEAESLTDLAERAELAVEEVMMPHVRAAAKAGQKGIHVAIVSHGLCISELVPALVIKDVGGVHPGGKFKGLLNTAWTTVTVNVKGAEGEPLDFADNELPPLEVRVADFNCHEHLEKVARQKGGIGSSAHDPAQQDIRAFFGGNVAPEEGRSKSNARDEVDVKIE